MMAGMIRRSPLPSTQEFRTPVPAVERSPGALERAARVLDAIARDGPLTAAEIAVAVGVDRSTAWRLTKRLVDLGWLRPVEGARRFAVGLHLFEIGSQALETYDLRAEWRRVMTELVAETGESADVAVLDGDSAVFIDKVDGTHEVRAFTRIGQRVPLHAVAVGKVFLAWMDDARREAILRRPLVQYTPRTIIDPATLRQVIAETRERGWALNQGELHPEAGGLAVPILDRDGSCVGGLGINIPLSRFDQGDLDGLIGRLVEGGRELSRASAAVSPAGR